MLLRGAGIARLRPSLHSAQFDTWALDAIVLGLPFCRVRCLVTHPSRPKRGPQTGLVETELDAGAGHPRPRRTRPTPFRGVGLGWAGRVRHLRVGAVSKGSMRPCGKTMQVDLRSELGHISANAPEHACQPKYATTIATLFHDWTR